MATSHNAYAESNDKIFFNFVVLTNNSKIKKYSDNKPYKSN